MCTSLVHLCGQLVVLGTQLLLWWLLHYILQIRYPKTATRAVAQVNDHGEGVLTEAEKVQEGVEATRANDNIKEMN